MALANYTPACGKNIPGNSQTIFIAPAGTITALAETSGEISTLTAASTTFKKITADIDTVTFSHEGSFGVNGAYTQTLVARFRFPSTELNVLVDELVAQAACGFEIIHVDANGRVWLTGVSITSKEGSTRPWNTFASSLASGAALTDTDTQADTFTFTRVTAYRATELDSTLAAAVLGGTAAYIAWS